MSTSIYINHEDAQLVSDHTRCALHSSNGLAIKTAASADAKTTAASVCSFKNTFYSLAAQATLDLSTATEADDNLVIADEASAIVICWVTPAGVVSFELRHDNDIPEFTATSKCCFGIIKIVNASDADFTVGTTALDATGITATYYTPMFVLPGETF